MPASDARFMLSPFNRPVMGGGGPTRWNNCQGDRGYEKKRSHPKFASYQDEGELQTHRHPKGPFAESRDGLTVWFTGLSSSGKTTLSRAVYDLLTQAGQRAEILDGDAIRRELCKELGFTKQDRDENIRRIGFVANLLARNGVIVLVSAISPYREIRQEMRNRIGRFIEVYVNAPLAVCEQRDVKGLYRRARAGELKCFTGVDDPYEPPLHAEVVCRTDAESVEESARKVLAAIYEYCGKPAY